MGGAGGPTLEEGPTDAKRNDAWLADAIAAQAEHADRRGLLDDVEEEHYAGGGSVPEIDGLDPYRAQGDTRATVHTHATVLNRLDTSNGDFGQVDTAAASQLYADVLRAGLGVSAAAGGAARAAAEDLGPAAGEYADDDVDADMNVDWDVDEDNSTGQDTADGQGITS